jgi:hypothetical protein
VPKEIKLCKKKKTKNLRKILEMKKMNLRVKNLKRKNLTRREKKERERRKKPRRSKLSKILTPLLQIAMMGVTMLIQSLKLIKFLRIRMKNIIKVLTSMIRISIIKLRIKIQTLKIVSQMTKRLRMKLTPKRIWRVLTREESIEMIVIARSN